MLKVILLIVLIFSACHCRAQFHEAARFTTVHGLPSNHIYQCVEDKKGFLWITTDAGVARYDGSHFQVFTTVHGVPDNEVLQVVKEKNGRIWLYCFNQRAAYFDEVKNRFINYTDDSLLAKLNGLGHFALFPLPEGGVVFRGMSGSYVYLNNRCYEYPHPFIININKDGTELQVGGHDANEHLIVHQDKHRALDQFALPGKVLNSAFIEPISDSLFYLLLTNQTQLIKLSNVNFNPLHFDVDTLQLISKTTRYTTTDKYLIAYTVEGHMDVYDKKSNHFLFTLKGNYTGNNAFNDHNGNLWVSTIEEGLILYRIPSITSFDLPVQNKDKVYLSITGYEDGTLLLGNYTNEIVVSNGRNTQIHKLKNISAQSWQRNIVVSQNKVFSFSGDRSLVNYHKELMVSGKNDCLRAKSALSISDSIMISGDLRDLFKINSITEKVTFLKRVGRRITSLATIDRNNIYFGSIAGLYKYDIANDTLFFLNNDNTLNNERIVSLCTTKDGLLWVVTSSKGILALKNDQVVIRITKENGLATNNIITITGGKNGQLWVGTNEGISVLNYEFDSSITINKMQNLSIRDGLTSNVINQMFYRNDTMYAATNSGVSVIPADISIPEFDIPLELIGVKINNRDTTLLNYYKLKANQTNIILQFAGIELTGHFRNAQYTFDNGITWIDNEGRSLSLQRGSGEYEVWMRSVDVNGNNGTKILKLRFYIATPFYKTAWFWLGIAILILAISLYANTIRARRKHQQRINELMNQQTLTEFEIQALKAQMNPHFVFNCMNSIQALVYKKDFEKVDVYMRKFSHIMRSTLHYSSQHAISLKDEIEYIETYIDLEKLRFGNKFEYVIHVEDSIPLDEIAIPAMLLQPYIENAIKHGVCNLKNKQGRIEISLYLRDTFLHIQIRDNGVGRGKAMALKGEQKQRYESKGTGLTQRRIELYHIELRIDDNKDKNGAVEGTTINLKIPVPL